MLFPRQVLNGRHPATAQFARGAEQKMRWLAEAETRESSERALTFRYLGWVLTAGYNDWLAVVCNLGESRKSWGRLSRILIQEGADPKVSGNFYKVVV